MRDETFLVQKVEPSLFSIGTESEGNGKYVYVDYKPPSDISLRYPANYSEISACVLQEYGLKVTSRHVTQVKRKHGIITQGGQSRPLPEGVKLPKVPPEIEVAIEASLRHFWMLCKQWNKTAKDRQAARSRLAGLLCD